MKEFNVYNKYLRTIGPLGQRCNSDIDETKIEKNKYHRVHTIKEFWAIGMVERISERKIIIIRVGQRNADTLIPILLSYLHLESTIHQISGRLIVI
jgi:hypothetical protein